MQPGLATGKPAGSQDGRFAAPPDLDIALAFFPRGSEHPRFPFWLAELSATTTCASCLPPIRSSAGGNRAMHSQPERLIIISLGHVDLQGILISRDTFTPKETKILSVPLNGHQKS